MQALRRTNRVGEMVRGIVRWHDMCGRKASGVQQKNEDDDEDMGWSRKRRTHGLLEYACDWFDLLSVNALE